MAKTISITGLSARDKALKGCKYVSEAILSTLGPFGSNGLLEKGDRVTNDGYLLSQQICPTIVDEFERRGAIVAHQASAKTNDMVGDATSTAWGLTNSILNEAVRYLPSEKSIVGKKSPSEVARWIEKSRLEVIEMLKNKVEMITDEKTLINSALVSVEDPALAEILGKTQWQLGPDGIILPEEVNDTVSSVEIVKGIRIDNGFSNSTIINNQEKQSFDVADTSIILTNYTIGVEEIKLLKDSVITPLLQQKKTQLVIMARAFTPDAIKLCVETSQAGFGLYPINAPYTDQAEIMRDLEAITGATYIDSEEKSLADIYITDVGYAKTLSARRFDAIITGVDDSKSTERIEKRVEQLKKKIVGSQSDYEKKTLETRIAQFTNGFAILKVGAPSVVNRKRIKDKCDDAVNSARNALKGGTVKGGGLAFKEISDELSEDNILKRPIRVIYDQIMLSAPEGFEIEEWCRDPFISLSVALTNACDVASTLATTNIIIVNSDPKDKSKNEED